MEIIQVDKNSKPLNILVVDDDRGDIKQFRRILKETGLSHQCTAVADIEKALIACTSHSFDCVFIDYRMPGMNGLDGLIFLHHQFPETPVIMLTGSGDEMVATEAMKRGAADYIIKENLSPELLKKSISNAIEKAFLEKQVHDKESKIEYIAYHDYLTNIPNRRFFHHDVSKAIVHAERNKKMIAVMLLDLDRFKNINDTLGHEAGDQLLKLVTARLQSVLRAEDTLARLGGDEFGVMTSGFVNKENAALISKNLIHSLAKSFVINNKKINITTSVGIALYPSAGTTVSDLLRNADQAMYVAKHRGGNNFEFYSPEGYLKMTKRLRIENALKNAVKNQELYLCYQPIYNLVDNSLFGVEALLRWHHPEFGKTSISEIISVAEESGLIIQICDWVLNEALRQFKAWQLNTSQVFKLAINLSAKNLAAPDWCAKVKKLTENYHIDLHPLIFELTETDVIQDMKNMNHVLSELITIGAEIFIDDFGTGFSSISMIQNLPVSGFKNDQSCIQGIEQNETSRNLVKSLFVLADNMKLTVVVEGIETQGQLDFVKSYAKGKGQGYYLSKPILANEFEKLVKGFEHSPADYK